MIVARWKGQIVRAVAIAVEEMRAVVIVCIDVTVVLRDMRSRWTLSPSASSLLITMTRTTIECISLWFS